MAPNASNSLGRRCARPVELARDWLPSVGCSASAYSSRPSSRCRVVNSTADRDTTSTGRRSRAPLPLRPPRLHRPRPRRPLPRDTRRRERLDRPAGARMHLPVSRRTRPHMIDAVEKVENTAAARVWQRSARSELLAREAFVAKVGRPGRNLPLWQRCKDLCVGSELQNARARQSLRRGHEFLRQHRGDEPVADRDCQRDPRGRSPIAEISVSGQPRRGLQQRGLW